MRVRWIAIGMGLLVGGLHVVGCAESDRHVQLPASSAAPAVQTPPPAPTPVASAVPAFDPAKTITVFANGYDPSGATSGGDYGNVRMSRVARKIAGYWNVPRGDTAPTAPNQMTEVQYYGSNPPAYYTAQDLAEVNAARQGVPRYAHIVAKFVRHVLAQSGAEHVNLVGGSFGGLITRYVIEKDLEGLASSGKFVRWLNVESTCGGVWVADQAVQLPWLVALAQAAIPSVQIDVTDLPTMTYGFVRAEFNTPDRRRSVSPFFGNMLVGFTVSGDDSMNNRMLSNISLHPNDGVLLSRDQVLTQIDAKPGIGAALVHMDTTHFGAPDDEGLAVNVVNFLRSRRRARVRLLDAEARVLPEMITQGAGEVVFTTEVHSPAALAEWGITDALSATRPELGIVPMTPFATGDVKVLDQLLYDWYLAPGEQSLDLTLTGHELDRSDWYSLYETASLGSVMGTHTLSLPVSAPGVSIHVVDTGTFRATVEVEVFDE